MNMPLLAWKRWRLVAEVKRLTALLDDLVPYAASDALCGVYTTAPEVCMACTPEAKCLDCLWYEESTVLLERFRSGEFGELAIRLANDRGHVPMENPQ